MVNKIAISEGNRCLHAVIPNVVVVIKHLKFMAKFGLVWVMWALCDVKKWVRECFRMGLGGKYMRVWVICEKHEYGDS